MKNIVVKTKNKNYIISFEEDFKNISKNFYHININSEKVCILTDDNVFSIYYNDIYNEISKIFKYIYVRSFEYGEKSKNLDTVKNIYDFLINNYFDRKSTIIALGGGVVGDIAGFVASTYMRGINFIQIPTTLLSQVDSSVGGKVGIDFCGSKNIIGSFYQPEFVYININTLKTLSDKEFYSGISEIIKYGLILSKDFYNFIKQNKEFIRLKDTNILLRLVSKCCELKSKIISKDENENGIRSILNYGHTIGHSIEALKKFELIHGECVGIGMVSAMKISFDRGDINENEFNDFINLLKYFNIPTSICNIDSYDVYNQIFLDKKVKNGKINFVLIKKIGDAYLTSDISEEEIINAISYVIK